MLLLVALGISYASSGQLACFGRSQVVRTEASTALLPVAFGRIDRKRHGDSRKRWFAEASNGTGTPAQPFPENVRLLDTIHKSQKPAHR
jgi:hypothetical protein